MGLSDGDEIGQQCGEERSVEGENSHDCWSVGEFDELAVGAAPEASVVQQIDGG